FKTGHARRPVADDLAHVFFVAAGAVFGKLGAEHAGDERGPRVAHAARLFEEPPAELFFGIELLVMVLVGGGECLRHGGGEEDEGDPDAGLHAWLPWLKTPGAIYCAPTSDIWNAEYSGVGA